MGFAGTSKARKNSHSSSTPPPPPPLPTPHRKFLRLFTNKISYRIPYEDHDQDEVLLALVGAVYVAREREALETEEDLWRLLKTIYRSPESLIEWTAPSLLQVDNGGAANGSNRHSAAPTDGGSQHPQ